MGYVKYLDNQKEYSGESFTRTLIKNDGELWNDEDIASYSLLDTNGVVISTAPLVKSTDKKSITFVVPHTDTINLSGKYKLLVTLSNSNDDRINNVIAEYSITYSKRKA